MKPVILLFPLLGATAALVPPPELEIRGYKTWRAANKRPVRMSDSVAMLCRSATSKEMASTDSSSPHRPYYLRVYVNEKGQRAFLTDEPSKLPVGSVVVKEKLAEPDAKTPVLLTIMRKREPGYDSKNGDWEYAVAEGPSGKIIEQGRLKRCIGCHAGQAKTDFLYRSYLPGRYPIP